MSDRANPLQIKVYFATLKQFQKIIKYLNAIFIGLWLGILKRENLHLVDGIQYNKDAMYRDDDYNLSGLRNWEKKVLESDFQSCKSLLVSSVGGGREVVALRKLGYQANGFECNANLVEFANQLLVQEGFEADIQLVERDACWKSDRSYDGAIVGWGSYMLIQGREHRIDFLKNMRQQIDINSPILLSFYHHAKVGKNHRLIAKIANLFKSFSGKDKIEPGDTLVPNYVHLFTEKEITAELEAAGFKMLKYRIEEYAYAVGIAV